MGYDENLDQTPVRRVILRPEITEQDDGSWRASYPGSDWFVEGSTKTEAIELLKARRDDEDAQSEDDLEARLEKLLADPPPGLEVTYMTREE